MKWISVKDNLEKINDYSYLVAGNEYFGIATWTYEFGWTEIYMGDFPFGTRFYKNRDDNNIIKFYCDIPEYPE